MRKTCLVPGVGPKIVKTDTLTPGMLIGPGLYEIRPYKTDPDKKIVKTDALNNRIVLFHFNEFAFKFPFHRFIDINPVNIDARNYHTCEGDSNIVFSPAQPYQAVMNNL